MNQLKLKWTVSGVRVSKWGEMDGNYARVTVHYLKILGRSMRQGTLADPNSILKPRKESRNGKEHDSGNK